MVLDRASVMADVKDTYAGSIEFRSDYGTLSATKLQMNYVFRIFGSTIACKSER